MFIDLIASLSSKLRRSDIHIWLLRSRKHHSLNYAQSSFDEKIHTITNSDSEGKYHFRFDSTEQLRLTISVNLSGFLKEEKKIESGPDDQLVLNFGLRLGRLMDPAPSHTQVVVRKSNGEPVEEAKIVIYCPFNDRVSFTGKTDKNGIYNLDITEGGQFQSKAHQ